MKDKLIIIDENLDIYLIKNNNFKITLEMLEYDVGCETVEEILNEVKYILKKSEEINRELRERGGIENE